MADPFSITVGLLTILHAARTSVRGLRACHDAPQELERLRYEVENLESLLESTRTSVEQNPFTTYQHILQSPLARASTKINSVNKILSSTPFNRLKLNNKIKSGATFLRYKHRIATLEQEIRSSNVDLGVRLSLITA